MSSLLKIRKKHLLLVINYLYIKQINKLAYELKTYTALNKIGDG